ncbi:MAG: CheY-like chemotaxis protein [Candidatus Nitrosomirales archaeon]|jgi:CheY-like chemotaxis protein
MKILIAEDDVHSLDMSAKALELRGHEVIGTTNGQDCLKIYHKSALKSEKGEELSFNSPFDAVILDYKMPKMDGKQVAKEILSINPDQRIIFVSAYVKETLMESVKELNQVMELIQKPFEPDVLVDLVENVQSAGLMRDLRTLASKPGEDGPNPSADQIQTLLEALQKIQKAK